MQYLLFCETNRLSNTTEPSGPLHCPGGRLPVHCTPCGLSHRSPPVSESVSRHCSLPVVQLMNPSYMIPESFSSQTFRHFLLFFICVTAPIHPNIFSVESPPQEWLRAPIPSAYPCSSRYSCTRFWITLAASFSDLSPEKYAMASSPIMFCTSARMDGIVPPSISATYSST